ncbi:MAG TPA: hypothetical protein DCY13_24710 [Verrucomicrobiales bacterium]|nr:hypothetical protein [Verrucomicrobiales bacterium]
MNIGEYKLGWFDFLFVTLIIVGLVRGRKRGMTQEFPLLVQWLIIVGGGAFLYKPLGSLLSDLTGMGKLFWFVTAYLMWAALVKGVVTWIVRSKGDKLALSDTWGRGEYPLGMISGMIRFVLVAVFSLALLNARLYSTEELKAMAKFQQDNFGNVSMPTIGTVQRSVFRESFIGKVVKEHAAIILVEGNTPRGVRAIPNRKNKEKKNAMDYWS